jgi:hypothetical protein
MKMKEITMLKTILSMIALMLLVSTFPFESKASNESGMFMQSFYFPTGCDFLDIPGHMANKRQVKDAITMGCINMGYPKLGYYDINKAAGQGRACTLVARFNCRW